MTQEWICVDLLGIVVSCDAKAPLKTYVIIQDSGLVVGIFWKKRFENVFLWVSVAKLEQHN